MSASRAVASQRGSKRRMTEPTFEQAQAELEQIVGRLEQGQASLDDAIALWERGEQLYAFCRQRLDAAEGKVEELARRVEQAKAEAAT
jgi:exodeoxyribonuclease VII small subunit